MTKPLLSSTFSLSSSSFFFFFSFSHFCMWNLSGAVADSLSAAQNVCANEEERNMLEHYILSFTQGSIQEHKEGSRFWIRDKV